MSNEPSTSDIQSGCCGPMGGGPGGGATLMDALHGEYVVSDGDTVLGNGNSGSDIERGDEVTIVAAVSGAAATADSVSEARSRGPA